MKHLRGRINVMCCRKIKPDENIEKKNGDNDVDDVGDDNKKSTFSPANQCIRWLT